MESTLTSNPLTLQRASLSS